MNITAAARFCTAAALACTLLFPALGHTAPAPASTPIPARSSTPIPARAVESANWAWQTQLPPEIGRVGPRANRKVAVVDKFFQGPTRPTELAKALAYLGQPDGFSPQPMYSKTKSAAAPSKKGGTLRFLLDDGGEIHISTADFQTILLAARYPKKGYAQLLYK